MSNEQPSFNSTRSLKSAYLEGWDRKGLENITRAVDDIEPIAEKAYLHRHAVSSKKDAESILATGLQTKYPNLAGFTHKMSTHFDNGDIRPESIAEGLFVNTHEARDYSIIIAIPKHPEYYDTVVADEERNAWENDKKSSEYAKEHIFEKTAEDKEVNVVPKKYIVGYWDNDKKEWHPNPLFDK